MVFGITTLKGILEETVMIRRDLRLLIFVFLAMFAACVVASAQSQTGSIFGKVTDTTGGVIPGVSVTITAPNLLQPLTALTSETGTYQFPKLEIGTYQVKFEQPGFKTAVFSDVEITVGFAAIVRNEESRLPPPVGCMTA